MKIERTIAFIDGFNLFHAIDRLKQPHLQWLNLWNLATALTKPKSERLEKVYYFSAFAKWLNDQHKIQKEYVKALTASGVVPIMGNFKRKDRKCPSCKHKWAGHEEKETDVNIALFLLDEAYMDAYDHALLVTRDSDMTPAIHLVRKKFPNKKITIVAPPLYNHSFELIQAAHFKAKINVSQLNRSLFPEIVHGVNGKIVARRPDLYSPRAISIVE